MMRRQGGNRWRVGVQQYLGYAAIALLIDGIGLWSLGTEIAGAVVAGGTVKLESALQVVQHPDGGVVKEVLARDGDIVAAGDVVLRIDDTFLRSELTVIEQQLLEIFARRGRLEAERADANWLEFGTFNDLAVLDAAWVAAQLDGQRSLFDARRVSLQKEIDGLGEQIRQAAHAITGFEAQIVAIRRQLDLIETESRDLECLRKKGLVPNNRLVALRKEEAGLHGEIGRLTASVAELKGKMAALEIEKLRRVDRRREEAIVRIRDLRYGEIELIQRRDTLRERLARLDLRAPASGTVFASAAFTENAVIQPGAAILYVVPSDRPFIAEVSVKAVDVDQVHVGQDVALRFSGLDLQSAPDVPGVVRTVSADAFQDKSSGARFYLAIVEFDLGGHLALAS